MNAKKNKLILFYLLILVGTLVTLSSCVRPVQVELPKRMPNASALADGVNSAQGESAKANKKTISIMIVSAFEHLYYNKWKAAFEELHPDVEIKIRGYDPYGYKAETVMSWIVTELASGAGDDIICPTYLPFWKMNDRGMFEDLYPYLDKDTEVTRDDFYPNILEAMEVDGALYALPLSVVLHTYTISRSFQSYMPESMHDKLTLNLYEILELFEQVKQNYTGSKEIVVFDYASAFQLLRPEISRFVRPNDYYVNFGEEFLNFINLTDPYREAYRHYTTQVEKELWQQYDRRVFGNLVSNFVQFFPISNEKFVAPYYGLWLKEASDGRIEFAAEDLSINANSKNKDLAWEFIKFATGNEACTLNRMMTFPARKSVFKGAFLDKMDSFMSNYEYVDITQEEAKQNALRFFEEALGRLNYYSDSTLPFMQESVDIMDRYDQGLITAEEMAREMQDKLEIYINE